MRTEKTTQLVVEISELLKNNLIDLCNINIKRNTMTKKCKNFQKNYLHNPKNMIVC